MVTLFNQDSKELKILARIIGEVGAADQVDQNWAYEAYDNATKFALGRTRIRGSEMYAFVHIFIRNH